MATTISIPGGNGASPLIFTVNGTSTTNQALAFQTAIGKTPDIQVLSNPSPTATNAAQAPTGPIVNEIFSNGPATSSSYALTSGNQFTVIDVGFATTVTGSATGGDTVLGTGVATYDATGSNNTVTFIDGRNTYNGGTASKDVITGGSGNDTINTGTGSDTVFSGSGSTLINLNDATGGDLVYLGDGTSTVNANGVSDTVIAFAPGQTIFGGTGSLFVSVGSSVSGAAGSQDVIQAGSGTTDVFDSVGGNSIFGGTGTLNFIGGAPSSSMVADTIVGGDGGVIVFGATGNDISLSGDTSGSVSNFIAGGGNETLNGANAEGRVNFFGSSDATSTETVAGSTTGYNYFQTGAGAESILGGHGTNVFGITLGGDSAHITIFDFAAGNDSVNFLGETTQQVTDALNAATVGSINGTPDLTVTLSDNTTITFVGITSLSGHVVGGN